MGTPVMQKSFNSGEWAPQLYSRVDIEKYHSGAALLKNFFVDYRGGASTRPGTQYVTQAWLGIGAVRLIPFQASLAASYMLEFGAGYIRFIYNGAPVLSASVVITGVTNANPCVITSDNSAVPGNTIYIQGVGGTTQLNGNYYSVIAATGTTMTLGDLNGNPIDSTGFGVYTSGGTVASVYTIASPYAAADLALVKFAQQGNTLILCHPNYLPQILTLISSNYWTIASLVIGSKAQVPTGIAVTTTLAAGSVSYSYTVTSIDGNGEESIAGIAGSLVSVQDLRTTLGTNKITWNAVNGAVAYNVYKSDISYFGATPSGIPYGYIGQVTGTSMVDSNINPDFAITPPINGNPFQGAGVSSVTVNTAGTYTSVPSVSFSGGTPVASASAAAALSVTGVSIAYSGSGYTGAPLTIDVGNGVRLYLTFTGQFCTGVSVVSSGLITSGSAPATVTDPTKPLFAAVFNLTWGVSQVAVSYPGQGYNSVPSIVFSPAGAAATAVVSGTNSSSPAVPGFFQQRLLLGGGTTQPETINFSQTGNYYNYNTNFPVQADNAISSTLASGQVETIKSFVSAAPGLVVFTDKASWMINGGGLGTAVSPSSIVANRQSFSGANDVPPILNNYDILYVEEKGSSIRDATYNYYAQVFTGEDISMVSSHLFFGYQILQWTWAQAPFKLVWALRNDGALLTLTFAKEQQFIAWSHHDTQGTFTSVASIPEYDSDWGMIIDRVYVVAQRVINGNTVKYIERFNGRYLGGQAKNAWCVDAGIRYNGSPTTTFSGAQQLAGATVTGLADGVVIPPFTMPVSGTFTLAAPASLVTVGLAFTPQLQTLPIDTGEPTSQGKQKKITGVTVRCVDTLGLSIGSSFSQLVSMKDLILGNVGSMTNAVVTDLVTGDARTFVDPLWAEQGQFAIQQNQPLPATITGVIPQLTIGDTGR